MGKSNETVCMWVVVHCFYYYSYIKVFTITFHLQPIKTIPSKYNGRDIEVLNGIISDNTTRAEVALWRKLASTNLQVGDTIRLNQVTKQTATFTPGINVKLSSGRYTTIEVSSQMILFCQILCRLECSYLILISSVSNLVQLKNAPYIIPNFFQKKKKKILY